MTRLSTLLAAGLLALPAASLPDAAAARPSSQLLRLIDMGLGDYGLEADMAKLTTAQAAALHLELSSPEMPFYGSDFRTRQVLLQILRWNPETDPGR